MTTLHRLDRLFVAASLSLQSAQVVFFALRLWAFPLAMKVGWVIYALAVPAVVVSVALQRAQKAWYLVAGGFLYAAWAAFGSVVDIVHPVEWRSPILLPVFLPYVLLYVAAMMFYWWPLVRIHRRAWFAYTALYILSTLLNMAAH